MTYFSAKRDAEVINAGGVFCLACVVAKSLNDQSPDDRYCQGCYDFLLAEADRLPAGKRPRWVPRAEGRKPQVVGATQSTAEAIQADISECNTQQSVVGQGVADSKDDVTALMQTVYNLADQGMSSRKIAAVLAENGVKVSHMTVSRWLKTAEVPARVLSGER